VAGWPTNLFFAKSLVRRVGSPDVRCTTPYGNKTRDKFERKEIVLFAFTEQRKDIEDEEMRESSNSRSYE
jgi:hypothetical protein